MMTNYLKRSGMLVEPVEYVIPDISGGTFQYVPILNVLEKLLSHTDDKEPERNKKFPRDENL